MLRCYYVFPKDIIAILPVSCFNRVVAVSGWDSVQFQSLSGISYPVITIAPPYVNLSAAPPP